MEFGNILIGVISVFICVGPFIIIYIIKVNRQNKMIRTLQNGLPNQKISLGEHEFCSDFLVGIDVEKKYLLFLKNRPNNEFFIRSVDLSTVQSCKVIKGIKNIKDNQKSIDIIEQIDLCLISKNKKEERFVLFNDDENTHLTGELQCAEKWSHLINALILK
jgi:hypothetical protein